MSDNFAIPRRTIFIVVEPPVRTSEKEKLAVGRRDGGGSGEETSKEKEKVEAGKLEIRGREIRRGGEGNLRPAFSSLSRDERLIKRPPRNISCN